MENNLLYKDYNIFTKIPQIYLNLNTTITKNLNVFENTIIHKNLDVYQNTNIFQNLNVKSNVNITHNLITHKNIIGLSSLYVDKDSQFKSNLDIYGNLTVHGSKVNIVSEKTLIADPLIVFGTNQSLSSIDNSYGGFVISHADKFSGLVRKPSTSEFFLYKDINRDQNNSINDPDMSDSSLTQLANLHTYNVTSTHIKTDLLDAYADSYFKKNLTIYDNLNVYKNVNIGQDLTIDGNLVVSGNHTVLVTKQLDVTDPIITISNTMEDHDRGILIRNKNNKFSGLIRNDSNDEYFLIDDVSDPYVSTVPTTTKSTLVLKNINTSAQSFINGSTFISNNDITNKNETIAVFPNNSSSKNINFYKSTKFDDTVTVHANIDVTGNLAVSDKFVLMDTNSIMARGYSEFLGPVNLLGQTFVSGQFDIRKSIIHCDHINIRSFINAENTIHSKNLGVSSRMKVPVRDTYDNGEPGSIFFNTSSNLYESFDNSQWLPMGGINPYKDTNITNNLNVEQTISSNMNIVRHNLIIPSHEGSNPKLTNTPGTIYFNTTSNLYESFINAGVCVPMGGINPYKDTTITNNLNVVKKLTIYDSLKMKKLFIPTDNIQYLEDYQAGDAPTSMLDGDPDVNLPDPTNNYIWTEPDVNNISQLKIQLNDQENVIAFDTNHLVQLAVSTDLFQFYNVQESTPIYGNRITGLNDPSFNSFTKYYTIKEYSFFQSTILTHVEYYVSHSLNNSTNPPEDISFQLEIIKKDTTDTITTEGTLTHDNISIGKVQSQSFSSITFNENETVQLKLTLDSGKPNGHEIFARLYGHTKINPQISKLELTSTANWDQVYPSIKSAGGAHFDRSVKAQSFLTFTGCHIGNLKTPINYSEFYTYKQDNLYIFKSGLIVSVIKSTKIDINNSEFDIQLSSKKNEPTVFGIINKYENNNNYLINSLGEGAVWVSNINGDIKNGDYITTSDIEGYGSKQTSDILHNYTVAKCCSVIDWENVNTYINYYNKTYKIYLTACTYHCG